MACDQLTYSGVDASKWARAKETIGSEYGMHIESERGEESKSGFTLSWTYDPSAQTLEIQCREKPFLIPCGVVNNRINALAEQVGIDRAKT
jgi:hypothetical protein